ncbi:membrane protein [Desulfuromonas versatilis]|uniref:Membrane protein n=1 Tax=Desulfuromonas versatilis TaxID=2802975 RepID=A0ABN6DWX3_9BACT|nr:DUF502 domain-containing protein [Desulfuromonas versatilis]BCR04525.1 membrane protein [Desulfuromonas versatilis]
MDIPQTKKRRFNPGWFLLNHLRRKLGAGLLVVVPIGLTLFILRFLFNLADGVLAPYIQKTASFFLGGEYRYIPGLGMIAGVLVVYITGIVASNVFGSRMVSFGESIMSRIPLVKSIYTSSKQFMQVFSKSGKNSFRKAVYVEFPMEGSFSIAFITNSVATASGKTYYTVFIPTSPNPTSGYVLILEEHRVYPTSFSVEEAMKVIMSGGMVAPEMIRAEKLQ